jgi:hypothetical protein
VIYEDGVEAAIGKDGAAKFRNSSGRFQPALRFRVEISEFLQRPILFFR